jgi:hypothetical protein
MKSISFNFFLPIYASIILRHVTGHPTVQPGIE